MFMFDFHESGLFCCSHNDLWMEVGWNVDAIIGTINDEGLEERNVAKKLISFGVEGASISRGH